VMRHRAFTREGLNDPSFAEMTSRDVVLAAANVLVEILRKRTHRERNKRKFWVREWIKRREMRQILS
jgi:hypothetical protein